VVAYDAGGNSSAQSTSISYTIADTTAPTVPSGLSMSANTATSITFTWTASTDNVGVTGYKIYRSGTQINTSATNSFTNTGLAANSSYSYTVAAYDAAGNNSAQSTAGSFSTSLQAGDANGDGYVNVIDLSIMATNYGDSGMTRAQGDLNGDGSVNVFDLSILAANWGA
jgi:fibronectin type 3 domain-containing protein